MIGNKRILCVVTARAGSKGIKGKNYKELLGKPLFIWSVLASLQSKYIDMTVLSSNCCYCEDIFSDFISNKMEEKYRDKVCFIRRPEEYATDLSKNEDALIHALKAFDEKFDVVINLQPTSPCRFSGLLDRAIEAYYDGEYDSLLTATKDTPFLWQKINGEWRYPVDKNDCCERKMRQEFEEDEFIYHDNGNIYLVDSKVLLDTECRIGHNPCIYETVGLENKQIDEDIDFEFIGTMLKIKGIDSPVGDTNG